MPGKKSGGTGSGYEGIGEEKKRFEQPKRNDPGQGGFERGTNKDIGTGQREQDPAKRGSENPREQPEKRTDVGTDRDRTPPRE